MTNLEQSYPGTFAVENEDVCFIQTVEDLERCTPRRACAASSTPPTTGT